MTRELRARAIGSLLLGLGLLAVALGAADPPEVVSVRVPSARIADWFPPGTELRGLSAAEFNRLVEAARSGAARTIDATSAALVRAVHRARWEEGRLVGRSELTAAPGATLVPLEPWTPAIEPSSPSAGLLSADDAGRIVLRPAAREGEPPPENVAARVEWQLRARAGSRGRKFALALPEIDTSELILDLPDRVEPIAPGVLRIGPTPREVQGRSEWRFVGRFTARELLLVEPDANREPWSPSRLWVEGPTRIVIEDASADWSLDWLVESAMPTSRRLIVALDPGLEVVSVTGPEVEGYDAEPTADGSSRLNVRLLPPRDPSRQGPTRVSIRALAAVPVEGRWQIPAARPLNAVWTGGETSISLGAGRVVDAVEPLAGRRHVAGGLTIGDERRFEFEADRPASVAAFVFRKPAPEVVAEVRGRLIVGNTSPRLNARILWTIRRGRPQTLAVDLPPSWLADRVEFEGSGDPAAWHQENLPGGRARVIAPFPSQVMADTPIVMALSASSAIAGGRGPMALPRVRPIGARMVDEVWTSRVEPGLTLRPTTARGLAWIAPDRADVDVGESAAPGEESRPTLAWRWTGEDAEARVERERAEVSGQGLVSTVASLTADHFHLDSRISLTAREEASRAMAFSLSEPIDAQTDLKVVDEVTGVALRVAPVDRADAETLGRGPAWRVDLPQPQNGRIRIAARLEGRWSGHGRIPLVLLPRSLGTSGTLLVRVARNLRAEAATSGVQALAPELLSDSVAADVGTPVEPSGHLTSFRNAFGYTFDAADDWVEMTTEPLSPATAGGVIREAILTTLADPDTPGPRRERLVLKVVTDRATTLEVGLPHGTQVERIRRDGQPLTPVLLADALSIPLLAPATASSGGSRAQVNVLIDYTTPDTRPRQRLQPIRPRLSLPTLGLTWKIVLPRHWRIARWDPALTPSDPELSGPDANRSFGGLTSWGSVWLDHLFRRGVDPAAAALQELNARAMGTHLEETALADLFTRWDHVGEPLLIDRQALAAAGLGPRSRVVVPVPRAADQAATEVLSALGLALRTAGRTLLITTDAQLPTNPAAAGPAARRAWDVVVADAVAWGSDASDRFQTVGRWREELTPRRETTGDATESPQFGDSRVVHRFLAPIWSEAPPFVELIDERSRVAWAWSVGFGVTLLGLLFRTQSAPRRAAALTVVLISGVVALLGATAETLGPVIGWLGGGVTLAALSLGTTLPNLSPPRSLASRSTVTQRRIPGSSLLGRSLLGILLGLAFNGWLGAQPPENPPPAEDPIIAVWPYDGAPDPARSPDHVLLRLSDYERLNQMARTQVDHAFPLVRAVSAEHIVHGAPSGDLRIESRFELVSQAQGHAPAFWSFPVADVREITATVDGKQVPVHIAPGGRSASIRLDGDPGSHRFVLQRVIRPQRGDWGQSIALAVNPVATARVTVAHDAASHPAEVPGARGLLAATDDGTLRGTLGPVNRLEVRWLAPGATEMVETAGAEGSFLWDATAAGDRLRARLIYRNPRETSRVRIRLEPGLNVRSIDAPGVVDASMEGSAEQPELVIRIEPPLPDGGAIALDLWRPVPEAPAIPPTRRQPRVVPLGIERFSGVLGFRRPTDWNGRLVSDVGLEAVSDEAFLRGWGPLPVDPLAMAGAVKLTGTNILTTGLEVATGPRPAVVRVQPSGVLTLAQGRIDAGFDAEITQLDAAVHELTVACPADLRLTNLSADGLTDWNRTRPDTLTLRFDGPALKQRHVSLRGWIPTPTHPLAPAPLFQEMPVPWTRWVDQDEQPGVLTIVSSSRQPLVGASGATLIPAEPTTITTPTAPFRVNYRVHRGDDLGRLRWEHDPPRVNVRVQSQLTVHLDTVEWVAALWYDVAGGSLDAINLRLPSDWARDAVAHLGETAYQQETEVRGDATFWSIRPERPIWGSQKLVVRSIRPFSDGESITFPELNPLGWGGVDTHLRVVNLTGSVAGLEIDASPALQQVASASLNVDDELIAPSLKSSATTSYHVVKPGWSLRLRKSGERRVPGIDREGSRVDQADLSCVIGADGSVIGQARYQVPARSGAFLSVALATGAEPLWATVNGSNSPPLRAEPGRWAIPLAEESVSRVNLVWKAGPAPAIKGSSNPTLDGLHPIALPLVGRVPVPTTLSLRVPEGIDVSSPPGRMVSSNLAWNEQFRARAIARETIATLGRVDRTSRRDGENLVAALVRLDLALTQAERTLAWDDSDRATAAQRAERWNQARPTLQAIRAQVDAALHDAQLEPFSVAARRYLGLNPGEDAPAIEPAPEPPQTVSVRPIGRLRAYHGEPTTQTGPWLVWTTRTPSPSNDWLLWLVGLWVALAVLPIAAARMARRARLARPAGRAALAGLIGSTAYFAGPWYAALTIALALLGRWSLAAPHSR